ncbi:protein ligase RNF216 [Seminavis robusta]|uniref:Protein ligase RNF216 n=1 Tax=Seminavis robusta TaxID=568900 RepID=A0A9N8EDE5_9STRA|nr:protein ligase RNF216 [Seminavis robusta]|eukprot:Sro914_g219570.1 protein ligase RNF216 (503) ;mRNA; r:16792-18300
MKTSAYKNQCKKLLENTFPRVSCAAITAVLDHVEFSFSDAFGLLTMMDGCFPDNDMAKATVLSRVVIPAKIRVFLKNNRTKNNKKRFYIRNAALQAEIDAIPQLRAKENKVPVEVIVVDDDDDDDVTKENDGEVECGCCYGDFRRSEMSECSGKSGHLVCSECIYRFVSEQLDGNDSVQFQCIIHQDCKHVYTNALLDQVLSPKLKQRTNDRIFREVVKQSGLITWQCPQCAFLGVVSEQDQNFSTIECTQCNLFYCKACQQPEHPRKTCQELREEQERLRNPVLRAQEAMTRAVKRVCPNCQKEFVKRDGCNKMKCVCGTLSCYLCGVQVPNYSHFCNHKNKPNGLPCNACGKLCELWTPTTQMESLDRKARREAGTKVLQEAGMSQEEIQKLVMSPTKNNNNKKKKALVPRRQILPAPERPVVVAVEPAVVPAVIVPRPVVEPAAVVPRPYVVPAAPERPAVVPDPIIPPRPDGDDDNNNNVPQQEMMAPPDQDNACTIL